LLVGLSGVTGNKVSWGMPFYDATVESLGLSRPSHYRLLDRLDHRRVFLAVLLLSSFGALVVRDPGWQAWSDRCASFLLATRPVPNLSKIAAGSTNAHPSNVFGSRHAIVFHPICTDTRSGPSQSRLAMYFAVSGGFLLKDDSQRKAS
jgi:hypothetical protein